MIGPKESATSQQYGSYDTQDLCENAASVTRPLKFLHGEEETRWRATFFTCVPEYKSGQ
jgi:hypothetical protein